MNDGSTDRTAEIIDRWAAEQPWILAVHRENRGRREPGGGVIEAFYEGYGIVSDLDWDYLVKLDGDLSFDPDYFEDVLRNSNRIQPWESVAGSSAMCSTESCRLNRIQPFMFEGQQRFTSVACWEQIRSLIRAPGWDTIDEVKANMLGWRTRSFENLKLVHYRFTGAANGAWQNSIKNGRGKLYIRITTRCSCCFKSIKRLVEKPYLVVSAGLLCGFVLGYIRRIPQIEDQRLDSLPSGAANPAPASKRQYLEVDSIE